MRTGLDFKSEDSQTARTLNLVQSELEDLELHQKRINNLFYPVLGLDQYTSPGIQYHHVAKIK